MARQPMTLEEIRAQRPIVDKARIAATTDQDIRRQQIEDGEDPDAALRALTESQGGQVQRHPPFRTATATPET